MRYNDKSPVCVKRDSIAFAIIADHIGVQNEGKGMKSSVNLVFVVATVIETQPELGMSVSEASHFDFMDTKERRFRATFFCQQSGQPLYGLVRKDDFQHKTKETGTSGKDDFPVDHAPFWKGAYRLP